MEAKARSWSVIGREEEEFNTEGAADTERKAEKKS
jgi:hypothetical protein